MSSIDAIRAAVSAIEQRRAPLDVLSIGPVHSAAYSPDKARFAVLGEGLVQVWRCAPFQWERSFLLPSLNRGGTVAFSRDGSWIAARDEEAAWRCDLAPAAGSAVAASASGGAGGGELCPEEDLVDPEKGLANGPHPLSFWSASNRGMSETLSPDGRWLVIENNIQDYPDHYRCTVWDLSGRTPPRLFLAESFDLRRMIFSPDSRLFAFSDSWDSVGVYDVRTGEPIAWLAPWPIEEDEGDDREPLRPARIAFWGSEAVTVIWRNGARNFELPRTYRLTGRLPSSEIVPPDAPEGDMPGIGGMIVNAPETIEIRHGATQRVLRAIPRRNNLYPWRTPICIEGPRGSLAVWEGGRTIRVRAPGRRPREFLTCVLDPLRLEWSADEQALMLHDDWGVAWYHRSGALLGRVPLPGADQVAFSPGERLVAYLDSGKILRWNLAE